MDDMFIRNASILDMQSVARLHKAAYGAARDHFTAKFSEYLLMDYYAALLSGNPYSYIAFSDTNYPIGFIVAGFNTKSSVRAFVRKHRFALARLLLSSPRILTVRLGRVLRRDKAASSVPLRLFSIAVEPAYQTRGAGRALLSHFEQELRTQGMHQYGLSVKATNLRAIAFYQANRFELELQTSDAKYYIKRLVD
jgi:ribosomal protein S18 acetylase RimI-like enzyme